MDRIERAKAALSRQRESQKAVGWGNYNGFGQYHSAATNPLLQVIGDPCEYKQDPRLKLPSYRALVKALSIIQLAIKTHADFIGVPKIYAGEKGNKQAVAVLDKFWNETPIHGQYINPIAADRGLETFTGLVIPETFRNGSSFTQLMRADAQQKSPITGIRLFDSIKFDYIINPSDLERVILQYTAPTNVIDVTPEMGINELHFARNADYPWGLPIAYGAELYAERWIRAMISYVNGTIRKGDPIGVTVIGFAPEKRQMVVGAPPKDPKMYAFESNQMIESTETLKASYREAIQKQRTSNQPQDQIVVLPGDVTLSSSYYGSGIDLPPNFKDLADVLLQGIASALGVPPSFLGLSQGASGGFSGELFRIQKETMKRTADGERRMLEQNCLRRICDQVLKDNRITVNADAYSFEWDEVDTSDEKVEAETRKIDAEATAIELLNITAISTELSGVSNPVNALNSYLDEIDREEWKV